MWILKEWQHDFFFSFVFLFLIEMIRELKEKEHKHEMMIDFMANENDSALENKKKKIHIQIDISDIYKTPFEKCIS